MGAEGDTVEHLHGEPLRHMGDLLAMGAHRHEDKTVFVDGDETLTFQDLEAQANAVAAVLRDHGVEPGDRIGLLIPNELLFPQAYFGAITAGGVAVPLNLRMDPETLVYVVQDAGIDHLIGSALLAEEAADLAAFAEVGTLYLPGGNDEGAVDLTAATADAPGTFDRPARAFDDIAAQPYTSGTTGQPKGVLLSHRNLLTTVEALSRGGLAVDSSDSMLLVLPLFHIYALNAIMASYIYTGGSMVLQPEPDGEAMLRAISERELTKFAGVPAMYTMMFREYRENPDAYDLSTLDDVFCGAAPLAEDTRLSIEEAWGVPVLEGWGMTETAPVGTIEPARAAKEAGSVGPPAPGVEIKLVDPETRETVVAAETLAPAGSNAELDVDDDDKVTGEIAIRGPNVFEGYYGLPEQNETVFDDDGWFYTEDIARADPDGYLWIVDRADDMIIAGGENIYPAEVEDALYAHPDVAEAGVVGAPHEVKGEAPVAFVVLEEGADVTERELREFSIDHVATYAHPRRVFFVDELPRSATQKVQRFKLEAMADAELDGPLATTEEEF